MTRLFLTVGCPSSGKSTHIRENADTLFENPTIVSRDEIRFSLLEDEDDYFKKKRKFLGYLFKRQMKLLRRAVMSYLTRHILQRNPAIKF